MVKQQLEDSFEKLVEEGVSQAKKTIKSSAQQIASSVNPSKMWEQILGVDSDNDKAAADEERSRGKLNERGRTSSVEKIKTKPNHTPLNLEKLGKSYQNLESQKTEVLKQRLFQLVKRQDEESLQRKKQQEEEKKQKEIYEIQEKKRTAEVKKKQEQTAEIPKGKVRRSIFSPRKVAERQRAEIKPASGKQ